MHPAKVKRNRVKLLTDLPNVGPATAKDFVLLGLSSPQHLVGKDPMKIYQDLCRKTGVRHDPCVLDVFISVTSFMNGDPPRLWWDYTAARRKKYGVL